MKQSIKKVAIDYALNRLNEIDDKYETTSEKSSQWRKAANKLHKDLLNEDKEGNAQISPYTYHSYLTDIRNAIKDTGRKHPALTSTMNRKGYLSHAIKNLSAYKKELNALAKMPANTIGNGKHLLKEQMHKELKGEALDKAIEIVDGLLVDHPLVAMLTKSKARKEKRAETEEKSLTQKSQNMKRYNFPSALGLAESLIEPPKDGESESYTALSWGLALLTGRRSAEIIYHAKFTKIDSSTVMFEGQLKKRQGTKAEAFPIPVLADADKVISALKRLRNMPEVARFRTGTVSIDGAEVAASSLKKRELNKAINQTTNGVLNERAKRLMNDDAEVFKNTRGIYARYCSDAIRPTSERWKGFNEDQFLKAVLGHESTQEIQHYRQVELAYDDNSDWLKVAEAKPEKATTKATEKPEPAKKNWRATKGIKEMGESIEAYADTHVELLNKEGKLIRKVSIKSIWAFHFDQLRFWCAANPTLKITQTAITKSKGNTWTRLGKEESINANRYTFQAWLQLVGEDAVNEYNQGKD